MNIWLFLSLLSSHIIGDFYLQSNNNCKNKEKLRIKSHFLYIHSLIIGIISWIFVPIVDFWIYILVIIITHLSLDTIKTYMTSDLRSFIIDQVLHIAILFFISCTYITTSKLPIQIFDHPNKTPIILFIIAILLCLKPTNILIKLILVRYKLGETESCKCIKSAGALIGNLERILTLAFVMIGQYEAIGFIIAAKSLLRFKESDTAKTEYVLAGTLLSFGIATICGLTIKQFSTAL